MRASAAVADRSPSPADPPRTAGAAKIEGRQAKPGQPVTDRSPPIANIPPSSHCIPPARTAGDPPVSADRAARARERAEAIYRAESRRVFATLVRLLGDFDLAEEALADAFRAALEQWPRDGVPANPRAWLVSAGRFKAIDGIRRHARFVAMDD